MMKSKSIFYIFLGSIALWISFTGFQKQDEPDSFTKTVKVALRHAGNKLLLANKDSTSIILPIRQLNDNSFEMRFQEQLSITPDSLVTIVSESLKSAELPRRYIVEVVNCGNEEVAYSYKIGMTGEEDIVHCAQRVLPSNCYKINVLFLNKTSFFNTYKWYVILAIIVVATGLFIFKRKWKTKPTEQHAVYTEIGNYKFYADQNKLVKNAMEIKLSTKECQLIHMLSAQLNQVVKRDVLIKEIWEDNGVFVGRSLDTFISKLRKKFKDDDTVNIVNVHGVGYKLEVG